MIYLMQLYKMIENKKLFIGIFSDLDYELNEMGWNDDPETLINDLLFNHFDLSIECPKQLAMITNSIINKNGLKMCQAVIG